MITKRILRALDSGILHQLFRFGIAGGLSSIIYILVYLPLTVYVFPVRLAVAAVPFAFVAAVVFGFFAHSRWSFRGHGTRDQGIGQRLRYITAQGTGMGINGLVTWVGTALLGLPPWAPLLPAILLAAVVTFILNRAWVFG